MLVLNIHKKTWRFCIKPTKTLKKLIKRNMGGVNLHNEVLKIKKCLGRLLARFVYNNNCNPQYII